MGKKNVEHILKLRPLFSVREIVSHEGDSLYIFHVNDFFYSRIRGNWDKTISEIKKIYKTNYVFFITCARRILSSKSCGNPASLNSNSEHHKYAEKLIEQIIYPSLLVKIIINTRRNIFHSLTAKVRNKNRLFDKSDFEPLASL